MSSPAVLQSDKLQALLRVSKAMASGIHLDELLKVIVEQATEVVGADRSSLFLYDSEAGELRSVVARGLEESPLRLAVGTGLAGYVARTRAVANVPDAYADPRFDPTVDLQTGFNTRSVLCMPIESADGRLLGVVQVLNKRAGGPFDAEDEAMLEAFCSHAAVALERARLVASYVEQQRMYEALKVARDIQRGMLPRPFLRPHPLVDLHGLLTPAMLVGGDLYDHFFIDEDRLGFAVGDVSGKGISASLFMAGTHTLLRSGGLEGLPPNRCFAQINRVQQNQIAMFVTLFYGVLHLRTGEVVYCNAGHPPPVLVDRSGCARFAARSENLPLGILTQLTFQPNRLVLDPDGMLLFLYTDGVTEAVDPDGDMFGEERLLEALTGSGDLTPLGAVQKVSDAVRVFSRGAAQRDDITMLAIRYFGRLPE